jgi:hypothetical protein
MAGEWFGEIQAAAQAVPEGGEDLAVFAKLDAVERMLARMQPAGDAADIPEIGEEYLRLLFAAYRYWNGGSITRELEGDAEELPSPPLDEQALRQFIESVPAASYFRLPQHRFWGQVSADAPHEPMDGFFLVTAGRRGLEWLIVAILGFRPDRGGFSQVSVTALAHDLLTARSLRQPAFAPVMDGGDLAGFRSVTSVGELLLLARLALVSTAH